MNPPPFSVSAELDSPEAVAALLTASMQTSDTAVLLASIGHIAEARGMTAIAERAGIPRAQLYELLNAPGSPRLDALSIVCKGLGLEMAVSPPRAKDVRPLPGKKPRRGK